MKLHINSFNELKIGDVIETYDDVFYYVGGNIYCQAHSRLIVKNVFDAGFQACPEGGSTKLAAHTFVGHKSLKTLRKIVDDFASNANDSRRDGKQNQKHKKQIV